MSSPDRTSVDKPRGQNEPIDSIGISTGAFDGTRTEARDLSSLSGSLISRELPTPPCSFGPYDLLSEIARGGMGVVYKAKQKGLDRFVAMKMVLSNQVGSTSAQQRFLQEAKSAAAIDHPNVVPIYDCGEIDGRLYFTMAYVEGPNLKHYVDDFAPLAVSKATSLFMQIVAGVAVAHVKGIIHRDLKPANVLIDPDGRPRVTDFGLAKKTSDGGELTVAGQVLGTPAYMAPEQARNSKDVGPQADVYALGAIYYFLLTGRAPFTAESIPELMYKALTETPQPLREVNPNVPADLEAICAKCLAKQVSERYPDAIALLEALAPATVQFGPLSAPEMPIISGSSGSRPVVAGLSTTIVSTGGRTVPIAPAKAGFPSGWAIAGVALLPLLVVGAYFALAGGTKKDVAAVSPATVKDGDGGKKSDDVKPNVETTDTLVWPPAVRSEFDLKVQLVGSVRKDTDGLALFPVRTPLRLSITTSVDCNLRVWSIAADGEIVQLLPNDYEPDARILANVAREIPKSSEYELETVATVGLNTIDRLRVIATTGPIQQIVGARRQNQYAVFKEPKERKEVLALRAVILKKTDPQGNASAGESRKVAESELQYRVR